MISASTNAADAHCHRCGGHVPAGAGLRWWESGPDDGGDVAGGAPAGWRVEHRDHGD